MSVRRIDLGIRNSGPIGVSAATISRERAGEKRQSVVKETTRKLTAAAGFNATARSPPAAAPGSK